MTSVVIRVHPWLYFLLVAAAVHAADPEPEVRRPQKPVDVGDVTLTDGRVLAAAAVLGDSAHTLTVRHGGRVEKIDKALLPPELLARWPVDPVRAGAEERDRQEAAARRAAEIEQGRRNAEAIRRENIAEAQAAKGAADKATAEEDTRRRAAEVRERVRLAQLARAPGGLFLVHWIPDPMRLGDAVVVLRNADTTPRAFDPRRLHGLRPDGSVLTAGDVVFTAADKVSLWLDPGAERRFTVRFAGAPTVIALAWSADSADWRLRGAAELAASSTAAAVEAERTRVAAEKARQTADRARLAETNQPR